MEVHACYWVGQADTVVTLLAGAEAPTCAGEVVVMTEPLTVEAFGEILEGCRHNYSPVDYDSLAVLSEVLAHFRVDIEQWCYTGTYFSVVPDDESS